MKLQGPCQSDSSSWRATRSTTLASWAQSRTEREPGPGQVTLGRRVTDKMLSEQREFETPLPRGRFVPLLLVALAAVLVIAVAVARQLGGSRSDAMGRENSAVGQSLNPLALEPLTGTDKPLTVSNLAGKVVLINFWGTWCGPCIDEFPHLKDLADHYRSQSDFLFVSVSCSPPGAEDPDLAANTAALLKEMQADFATYADPRMETRDEIARLTGMPGVPYPTTLILGRDGKIRGLWFGYREGLTDEMREVIDAALREKPA